MAAPREFTPEITEDYYNRLASRITRRGEADAGRARSEALSRNLGGDPYESSAVGLARQGTQDQLADLDADLAYRIAGLGREERLGERARGWQVEDRDFGAAEAEKSRSFEERMARLGQDQWRDREALGNRRGYQQAIWQLGAGLGARALSGGIF